MPKGKFIPFTPEDELKIKSEYLDKPIKRIASELNTTGGRIMRFLAKNNLEIPRELVEKRKKDSLLKPGNIPFNKGMKQVDYMSNEMIERTKFTRFKKGNSPHNENYDGHERTSKDGYIEIRIRKGKYRLKHLVEWEQLHGKIPKSHCLLCVDGNKKNTDPWNWKLISRSENMLRNSKHDYPEEIIPSMVLVSQINKKIKTIENVK